MHTTLSPRTTRHREAAVSWLAQAHSASLADRLRPILTSEDFLDSLADFGRENPNLELVLQRAARAIPGRLNLHGPFITPGGWDATLDEARDILLRAIYVSWEPPARAEDTYAFLEEWHDLAANLDVIDGYGNLRDTDSLDEMGLLISGGGPGMPERTSETKWQRRDGHTRRNPHTRWDDDDELDLGWDDYAEDPGTDSPFELWEQSSREEKGETARIVLAHLRHMYSDYEDGVRALTGARLHPIDHHLTWSRLRRRVNAKLRTEFPVIARYAKAL